MLHIEIPVYVKLATVAIATAILVKKIVYKQQYRSMSRRSLGYRWMWWYSLTDIQRTRSDRYRQFMKTNNSTTTAFWILFLIMLITLSLG